MQKNKKTYNETYIPLIALLVALVMMISFLVALLKFPRLVVTVESDSDSSDETSVQIDDNSSKVENPEVSEGSETIVDKETLYYQNLVFEDLSVDNRTVANGNLAVVKEGNKYFPSVNEGSMANIYANKTPYKYDLSGVALEVYESAFSGFDALFVKYADTVGTPKIIIKRAYSNSGSASNGSLDLATGYSVEINTISDDKVTFIREQSYKYGVIQRYPARKESYTGFAADSTIYRYVGLGHSYYMNYYKYCLEEYLDKIKTEKIIEFKSGIENNTAYVIYYVPADVAAGSTNIPVPINENCTYEISGDGGEGFIVAVKIQQ